MRSLRRIDVQEGKKARILRNDRIERHSSFDDWVKADNNFENRVRVLAALENLGELSPFFSLVNSLVEHNNSSVETAYRAVGSLAEFLDKYQMSFSQFDAITDFFRSQVDAKANRDSVCQYLDTQKEHYLKMRQQGIVISPLVELINTKNCRIVLRCWLLAKNKGLTNLLETADGFLSVRNISSYELAQLFLNEKFQSLVSKIETNKSFDVISNLNAATSIYQAEQEKIAETLIVSPENPRPQKIAQTIKDILFYWRRLKDAENTAREYIQSQKPEIQEHECNQLIVKLKYLDIGPDQDVSELDLVKEYEFIGSTIVSQTDTFGLIQNYTILTARLKSLGEDLRFQGNSKLQLTEFVNQINKDSNLDIEEIQLTSDRRKHLTELFFMDSDTSALEYWKEIVAEYKKLKSK